MIGHPLAPWKLACPWCNYALTVFGRGSRGNDEGSGYEAAVRMQAHVERGHGKSWSEFLAHDNAATSGNNRKGLTTEG